MSGICSAHQDNDPNCATCQATMKDLFPDWDKKVAEAIKAGRFQCICNFVYYLTTASCPLCSRVLEGKKLDD